jgi:type III secretion protein C
MQRNLLSSTPSTKTQKQTPTQSPKKQKEDLNNLQWDDIKGNNNKSSLFIDPSLMGTPQAPPAKAKTEQPVKPITAPTPTPEPTPPAPEPAPVIEPAAPPSPVVKDPVIPSANTPGVNLNDNRPRVMMSGGKIQEVDEKTIFSQMAQPATPTDEEQTILIRFNNVSIIEYIRYISRVANKNFIFSEEDLSFNVTIVSEEPVHIQDVMATLLQELRIHGLDMIEQGNTVIIHIQDSNIKAPGNVIADNLPGTILNKNADIVTRVFQMNTMSAESMASSIIPMLSGESVVYAISATNNLIVTDFRANVDKIAEIIKSVDSPLGGMIVGQYVVKNAYIDTLLSNGQTILSAIAPGHTITLTSHPPTNSIFIVGTPFIVERAIPILQRLDQNNGTTGIFNLNDMRYQEEIGPDGKRIIRSGQEAFQGPPPKGQWKLDTNGNWYYDPEENFEGEQPPRGRWVQDSKGHWEFIPGDEAVKGEKQPKGRWILGSDGKWRYTLDSGESIMAGKSIRSGGTVTSLPLGHIERTKFHIQKLQYRKGGDLAKAILSIGESLRDTEAVNADLISTINSVQWLEASNALVYTGTPEAILKVKELVDEMDAPLRQVFIEMLILETSIKDSLQYGVGWGSKFGGGDVAGAEAFVSGVKNIPGLLKTSGILNAASVTPTRLIPDAVSVIADTGYNMGIIGQSITMGGVTFKSISALVHALHEKADQNIVLNPKILTEDNVPAEIFVGENIKFKTQSVSNNAGDIITNNFEFRDVGTLLKVTPFLGPSNIITLEIQQERSSQLTGSTNPATLSTIDPGPDTSINKTKTRIHIPNGYFLVMSGMISDTVSRGRNQVPCLGGAPIIGAAFTDKLYRQEKKNLMIFIRPLLVDTEEEMQNLTKHQQNVWRIQKRTKKMWQLDTEEALDWMNLLQRDTNNDENECCENYY